MNSKHVGWYFGAFFGFMLIANTVFITTAVRTHTGSVTEHPYEKGLAYNQLVAAEQTQQALGWKAHILYKDGMLNVTLQDRHGHPLVPEAATAHFIRPTQAGMDFSVPLTGVRTQVQLPAQGLWEVRVHAVVSGTAYQQAQRLVIDE